MPITESQRVCIELGRMVHRAAARVEIRDASGNLVNLGSKSELARRAGVDKAEVEFVTRGEGHKTHPKVMRAIIMACAREIGQPNVLMMLQMSEQILYCPRPGGTVSTRTPERSPAETRVSNPLTYAERRI